MVKHSGHLKTGRKFRKLARSWAVCMQTHVLHQRPRFEELLLPACPAAKFRRLSKDCINMDPTKDSLIVKRIVSTSPKTAYYAAGAPSRCHNVAYVPASVWVYKITDVRNMCNLWMGCLLNIKHTLVFNVKMTSGLWHPFSGGDQFGDSYVLCWPINSVTWGPHT